MPANLKKFLNNENENLLKKIYTEILSNQDIYDIFTILFPVPTDQCVDTNVDTNFTGCFFISGHGKEGRIDRPTILKNMITKFKINEEELKEYIKKSVFMIISMGMVGVSSPMEREIDNGFRPKYTTSELDMVIPKTFFNVFNKYNKEEHGNKIKLNNDNLDLLHTLIKYQLRVNFYKIWSPPSGIALEDDPEVIQVMRRNEIWVLKELTTDSLDRSYFLAPNKDEDPKFFVHEGVHIIDIRDTNKQKAKTDETMTDEWEKMISELNKPLPTIETITWLKETFFSKKKRTDPKTEEEEIFDIIINKLKEKEPWIDLSDIIMLGYILDIKKLYIYDPACRPLFDKNQEETTQGPRTDRYLRRVPTY